MSQEFNEQYKTEVSVAPTGDYQVAFSGTKDGTSVSSTVTGNLNTAASVPAPIAEARGLFDSAQAEAAKILEA